MKIKINKNRKTFFFFLVLVDFVIAIQVAAVSLFSSRAVGFGQNWMSGSFMLALSGALPVFLFFSGMFKNSKRIKSVIRPGLVLMILGSLASFSVAAPSLFTFGRTICGLGAGMLVAGQIGIIWHEDFKKIRIFSLTVLGAFALGLIFGPKAVSLLAGPQFPAFKVVFLLGVISPVLVALEILAEIFVASCNVTFDATGAFFDIDGSDDIDVRARKVAAISVKRVAYNFFDYGVSIVCASLVGALNYWGLAFWKIALSIWLVDFIVAAISLVVSEKSGHDITLGESFRRAVDSIKTNSRLIGYLIGFSLSVQSLIWEGPQQLVVFFKKEIGTMTRMVAALVILTFFQGLFWAWIYSLGYESVGKLIRNFL